MSNKQNDIIVEHQREMRAENLNLNRMLAGEYCQSCKSHRLSLTDDLMISCKDGCDEHSFAPILLIEYLTVCRDLLKAKVQQGKGQS